jgi:predicted nucleotide-binding protein (sugar kinase/HSP70/actin superfamily)
LLPDHSAIGSYFLFQTWPYKKVGIFSKISVYRKGFRRKLFNRKKFQTLFEEYGIKLIAIFPQRSMNIKLRRSSVWILVAKDQWVNIYCYCNEFERKSLRQQGVLTP